MRYKVIRVSATDETNELQKAFEDGWQYKTCHIMPETRDTYPYTEYILVKKGDTDESK